MIKLSVASIKDMWGSQAPACFTQSGFNHAAVWQRKLLCRLCLLDTGSMAKTMVGETCRQVPLLATCAGCAHQHCGGAAICQMCSRPNSATHDQLITCI